MMDIAHRRVRNTPEDDRNPKNMSHEEYYIHSDFIAGYTKRGIKFSMTPSLASVFDIVMNCITVVSVSLFCIISSVCIVLTIDN